MIGKLLQFGLLFLLAVHGANLKIIVETSSNDEKSILTIKDISLSASTSALLKRIQRQASLPVDSFDLYTHRFKTGLLDKHEGNKKRHSMSNNAPTNLQIPNTSTKHIQTSSGNKFSLSLCGAS